jgi:hypothetical protein
MDATKPRPLGQQFAVRQVRQVAFTDILAAATVFPKGYMRRTMALMFGRLGRLLATHATDPLPATALYIAVTPNDFRIFARSGWHTPPFEVGRWNKLTYRSSIPQQGAFLKLDLDVERLGRIQVFAGLRIFRRDVEPVFQLVVQGALGPVI